MSKKVIVNIIITLIVIGIGLFIYTKTSSNNNKDKDLSADIVKVKRSDIIESIDVTGTIQPLKVIEVKSKASGKIIKMSVEQGDYLNEGALIAEIEKTFTQPDVDQAGADLRASKARLEQAKINIELTKNQIENDIKQKQENLKSAEIRLDKAKQQLEIDKDSLIRETSEAKNSLDIASLNLKRIEIGSRPEEIKRAESQLASAKANFELAQNQYNRTIKLSEQNFISQGELESADTQLKNQKSLYDLAVQNLEILKNPFTKEEIEKSKLEVEKANFYTLALNEKTKTIFIKEKELELFKSDLESTKLALEIALLNQNQVDIKKKEIEIQEAQVIRAASSLTQAQDRLKDTKITAPISGTILKQSVEDGQVISSSISTAASGTTLVSMADLSKLYIIANVDETDIGKVFTGQKVNIVVDAFPSSAFKGEVSRIAPIGEVVQNVTTFEVIIQIKNINLRLKPGMNASIYIIASNQKKVLSVPNEAIKEISGKKIVYVFKDGKKVLREIEVGVNDWKNTEIISGLEEGEEVVLKNSFAEAGKDTPKKRPTFMMGGGGRVH